MIYKKGKPTPNAKKISVSPFLTLLMQTKESTNVAMSANSAIPGLQLSSWKYFQVLILLLYLKVLSHEIYQNSNCGKRHQIEWNMKITAQKTEGGAGCYLGKFLLGTCRWPLRAPTPFPSILWPIIGPILVTFGQMCSFRDTNLVTFYFYEFTHFLDWMRNTLLFIWSTNILVRLLTINMKNCFTPKTPKMCDTIIVNPDAKMRSHPAAHPH